MFAVGTISCAVGGCLRRGVVGTISCAVGGCLRWVWWALLAVL